MKIPGRAEFGAKEIPIPRAKDAKGRRRIAFLLASIDSGSSKKVWPEMLLAARKRQCSLFIFPGGRLESRDEFEYMRNAIFDLVNSNSFDAAVSWASSLSGFASERRVERFHLERIDIPLATFGLKIGAHPVVNIDAYSGMKQLVRHLAAKHRRSRIAFLCGPREHSSAEDRFRAYRDALGENGIAYDERLVGRDNPWTEGRKAMESLVDEKGLQPGKDFDALCGASDLLVFGAVQFLAERGYKIPGDVAVGGFNDSDESNIMSPTYTTVRVPFDRQAVQAFHSLLETLEGGEPKDRVLKTSMVIRQSCGCSTESVRIAGSGSQGRWKRLARTPGPPSPREVSHFAISLSGASAEDAVRHIEPIVLGFLEDLDGSGLDASARALDASVNEFILGGRDLGMLQDVISAVRIACSSPAGGRSRRNLLENLVNQARVLISEGERRMSTYKAWKERALDHWLNVLNHELLYAKSFSSIVEVASRVIPRMGIGTGYFVLSGKEGGEKTFIGGFEASDPDKEPARLVGGGEFIGFPSFQMLPDEVEPSPGAPFIVLPLYFESTNLGYILLGADRSDAYLYEEIRALISSAMRGVLLFEEADEARKRAEKAERAKTEFLANISSELQEPMRSVAGIASELIKKARAEDMDQLKAIARYSDRQLELNRYLLDLSLAQVDEIALEPELFDPVVFLAEYAAGTASDRDVFPARVVLPPPEGTCRPLLFGDMRRLGQIFGIFTDCLFRDAGAVSVGLMARAGERGCALEARGKSAKPARAGRAEAILATVNSSSGNSSLGATRIGIELAKRIAFLHGASVQAMFIEGEFVFSIALPYPAFGGAPPRDSLTRDFFEPYTLGGASGPCFEKAFPSIRPVAIGLGGSSGYFSGTGRNPLIYLDPRSLGPEASVALGLLLESGAAQKACWYIECLGLAEKASPSGETGASSATRHTTFQASVPGSLPDLLNSFIPARSGNLVCLTGPDPEDAGLTPLAQRLSVSGVRLVRCVDQSELARVLAKEKPALIVFRGQDAAALTSVAALPKASAIPLLCVAPKLDNPDFERVLASWPRVVACNTGVSFDDLAADIAVRLAAGGTMLPSQTGLIVAKAIFILNTSFTETLSRWRLSESLNASEDYLSRIFRAQMGIPLWEYLNRLRIGYSTGLLNETSASVSEIASRSGFQDQAYFCRVFKKVTGSTPGATRKKSPPNVRKVQ